jgi:hypothetical protein
MAQAPHQLELAGKGRGDREIELAITKISVLIHLGRRPGSRDQLCRRGQRRDALGIWPGAESHTGEERGSER